MEGVGEGEREGAGEREREGAGGREREGGRETEGVGEIWRELEELERERERDGEGGREGERVRGSWGEREREREERGERETSSNACLFVCSNRPEIYVRLSTLANQNYYYVTLATVGLSWHIRDIMTCGSHWTDSVPTTYII